MSRQLFALMLLLAHFSFCFADVEPVESLLPEMLWNVESYFANPPKSTWGERKSPLLREVYYEGETWQGKPTRVFAYYGLPENPTQKLPAVLLIHGGGGKAFPKWVEHWVKRGYAALAMDLAGNGPDGRLEDGGPNQDDAEKFRDFSIDDGDYKNMWTYQSITAILRGHAFLLEQKEVDPDRIAATGLSWGGYLTCILAGVDDRLKAAVPVYGCGYLHENSVWKAGRFDKMSEEQKERWISLFDPSQHLLRAGMPILFVNGTNDFAYPPDSSQKTYGLPKGKVTISFTINRPHGHVFTFKEVDAFIDSILLPDANPLVDVTPISLSDDNLTVSATFQSKVPIVKAELAYTTDTVEWQNRKWKSLPATVQGNTVASFTGGGIRLSVRNIGSLRLGDKDFLRDTVRHADRLFESAKGVLGDDLVLLLAENQADRRRITPSNHLKMETFSGQNKGRN